MRDAHKQLMSTIGLCTLDFYLGGVHSLKEKRSILKSFLARLRKQFNVAVAEVDHHERWQSAQIAIVTVTNDSKHAQQMMDNVVKWIEKHYADLMITDQEIEII